MISTPVSHAIFPKCEHCITSSELQMRIVTSGESCSSSTGIHRGDFTPVITSFVGPPVCTIRHRPNSDRSLRRGVRKQNGAIRLHIR